MPDHAHLYSNRLKAAGPAGTPAGAGVFCWRARGAGRGGFTLVELVLILAILGTFAAVAAPRYGGAIARYRAQAAANRVVADLARAQAEARASSSTRTVEFKAPADWYGIAESRALDSRLTGYGVALSASPYEAALVSAALGGDSVIRFDGYGVPDSGGTIIVRSGREGRTITIAPVTGAAVITVTSDAVIQTSVDP